MYNHKPTTFTARALAARIVECYGELNELRNNSVLHREDSVTSLF